MNALFQQSIASHGSVQANEQHGENQQTISLAVAEEVPVALVYNGISHVVLMATPQHLVELAYGFSLSEGIIEQASQIYQVETEAHPAGISVHIELASACFVRLKQRRRQMSGRTGCGLCGIEALSQINMLLPHVGFNIQMTAQQLAQGFSRLTHQQPINQLTGGCHAAALWQPEGARLQVFEDVGRHNALDKLIGWRLLNNKPQGALLLTSRLSYELIQKAAYAQLPLIAAISAPTGMAVRIAQQAGIQLAVFVREGRVTWI
jgi:FdhD protein